MASLAHGPKRGLHNHTQLRGWGASSLKSLLTQEYQLVLPPSFSSHTPGSKFPTSIAFSFLQPSGRELGTSRKFGRELGISHRSSGRELGTSHRFESGMELGTSHRFEWGMEQGPSHRQFWSGMGLGISQRHHWYPVQPLVPSLSHKMEGTVAASAGHTLFCGFAKSVKKGFIRTI